MRFSSSSLLVVAAVAAPLLGGVASFLVTPSHHHPKVVVAPRSIGVLHYGQGEWIDDPYSEQGGNNNNRFDNHDSWGGQRSRSNNHNNNYGAYTRDTSRDDSPVDEAAVNSLLSERVAAKKRRDYDTADAIRDELARDYAVGVFDRERTWRTGWNDRNSNSGRGGRGGGGGGGRRQRDFGPNGHDYDQAGPITDATTLTENDIHGMLAERLQAKMSRNFHVADDIQAELASNGVYVHDGNKEWRADGVPFGDFNDRRDGRPGRSYNSRNQPYEQSVHSPPPSDDVDPNLIDRLVQERAKFKQMRDYDSADKVREGLRTQYNVLIDDRLREWSVGGDFGTEHNAQREMDQAFSQRMYVKSASSLPLAPEDEAIVQAKVDERSQAKRDRDFDTADRIRDELAFDYDIMIQDKLKMWSAGGDFGAEGGPRKPGGSYTRRGGGDLTDEDVETITSLLKERHAAKKLRHYETADEIRDHLRQTFNVIVDDKSTEWHVDSDEYVQANAEGSSLSQEQVELIGEKLIERYAAKAERDYARADDIRDELAEKFNIAIDDRTKEWKCLSSEQEDGNNNAHDADQSFAEEARMSQSSAFKRTEVDRELEQELESIFTDEEDEEEDEDVVDEDDDIDDDDDEEEPVLVMANATDDGDDEPSDVVMETEESLSTLKVVDLKDKLRAAGLPVSGTKGVLIERLLSGDDATP